MKETSTEELLEIDNGFDVVMIGTNTTNSLLSAGLAKNGQKTLIIEPTAEFGSSNASPSLQNLQHLLQAREYPEHSFSLNPSNLPFTKTDYTQFLSINNLPFTILHSNTSSNSSVFKNTILDLTPSPLLIKSTVLNFIVSSRLYNYMNFNCISNLYILKTEANKFCSIFNVPFDSESLIENKCLSRLQKYKLSKLITGNFENIKDKDISILSPFVNTKRELKNVISSTKVYNIKNNASNFNSLLDSVNTKDLERTATPFIYPSYGFSEIIQGILRMTSLSQGTVICNVKLDSIYKLLNQKENKKGFKYLIETNGATIQTNKIVINAAHVNKYNISTNIDINKVKIEYRLNFAVKNINKDAKVKYTKNSIEIFYIEKDKADKFINDIFIMVVSSNTERIKSGSIMFQVCCSLNNDSIIDENEFKEIDSIIKSRVFTFLKVKEIDLLFYNSFVYKINENGIKESELKEIENDGLYIVDNYCEYNNTEKLEDEMEKINDVFLKITGKPNSLFDVIKDDRTKEHLNEELNRLKF